MIAAVALVLLGVVGGIRLAVSLLVPLLPALIIVGGLLTWFVAAPMRAGSPLQRAQNTEMRRFRVTEVSGRQVDCQLVGELVGAHPRPGDVVDVFGRASRHGTVRVRAVVVTGDQTRITARPNFGFVLASLTTVAVVALSAACVIGVAYLMVSR